MTRPDPASEYWYGSRRFPARVPTFPASERRGDGRVPRRDSGVLTFRAGVPALPAGVLRRDGGGLAFPASVPPFRASVPWQDPGFPWFRASVLRQDAGVPAFPAGVPRRDAGVLLNFPLRKPTFLMFSSLSASGNAQISTLSPRRHVPAPLLGERSRSAPKNDQRAAVARSQRVFCRICPLPEEG